MTQPTDTERVRTFTWSDPLATAAAAASLPGLEAIRKIAAVSYTHLTLPTNREV